MKTQTIETQQQLTPQDALELLKEGNARFRENVKAQRDLMQQVSETSDGQWPIAVVLSCIDSRTSAELIFDQGIGDIFSARVAGNFVNDDILGSMEFACKVAGAKLVVVLGHSHCGAVKGACDNVELGLLTRMLENLKPAVDAVAAPAAAADRTSANPDFVADVARENVLRSVAGVTSRSEVLREMAESGSIQIVGGMHDLASGAVEFY